MGCCCYQKKEVKKYILQPQKIHIEEGGCYLLQLNDNLAYRWSSSNPEKDFFIHAKPETDISKGKLNDVDVYISTPTDEFHFLKGVLDFLTHVAPTMPKVTVNACADQAQVPFYLLFHYSSNGIMGGRITRVTPGHGSAYLDDVDAVGVLPKTAMIENIRPLPLSDFLKLVSDHNGVSEQFDNAGYIPAIVKQERLGH